MPRPLFASTLPVFVVLAASVATAAQKQPPSPVPPSVQVPTQARPRQVEGPPMPVIDVDFAGGTVGEYVHAVQKAAMESSAKTPVNVMVPAEAAKITIPAVSLKRVSAATALETLRYAFGTQGQHQFDARNMTNEGDESLTFAIQYAPGRNVQQMSMPVPTMPIQSEAYSLRDLILTPAGLPQDNPSLRMPHEAVLGALRIAADLEAGDERVVPTQLLFHPDTQLLIARGTPDQHRLISSVLAQLNETIGQRRQQYLSAGSRSRADELQKIELEAQIQNAQAQLDKARSEVRAAEAEVSRTEKLMAAGNVGSSEFERARANLDVARANVSAAEANVVMFSRRRDVLAQGAGGGAIPAAASRELLPAIYDLRDLAEYKRDFFDLVKRTISPEGTMEVKPISGDSSGSILVRATRAQHEVLVALFNVSRRLKANEPKLPGISLEQLLQQPKE